MSFNFVAGQRYVENCSCDGPGCMNVGTVLPMADGVYCLDCFQAAQDAVTDEMDEAFADDDNEFFYPDINLDTEDDDPRDYYQEMIDSDFEEPDYIYDSHWDE